MPGAAGRLGQKTSKGYYDYDENRRRMPSKEVEAIILDLAEKMQVRRRKIEDGEILERVLLPMVNEGASILEEGIAQPRSTSTSSSSMASAGRPSAAARCSSPTGSA